MENTNVNCVSVIFDTDFDLNKKKCLKLESCMILDDEYDEYLYKECARVEEKINGNFDLFEDEYDEALYRECALVEEKINGNFNLFEDEYDEALYRECALVEEKINRQVVGSLKRMNDSENANIAVKQARYEDGPSVLPAETNNTSASTSNNGKEGDDNVNCSTCYVLVSRRYFINHLERKLQKSKPEVHNSQKNVSVVKPAFGHRIIS